MKNMGPDDTAVSPNFRTAVMSLSCGVSPHESMTFQRDTWVGFAIQMSEQLRKYEISSHIYKNILNMHW